MELVHCHIAKLPPETQEVLKLAACIGAQFDLSTLAIVSETSKSLIVRIWQQPIYTVLMPLIEGYQAGLISGDLEFAAYCIYNRCQLAYATGSELQHQYGEKPMGWKASGNRIKRGLYRTYDGFVVNADLNGAANILKKVSGRLGLSLNQLSRRYAAVVTRIRLN